MCYLDDGCHRSSSRGRAICLSARERIVDVAFIGFHHDLQAPAFSAVRGLPPPTDPGPIDVPPLTHIIYRTNRLHRARRRSLSLCPNGPISLFVNLAKFGFCSRSKNPKSKICIKSKIPKNGICNMCKIAKIGICSFAKSQNIEFAQIQITGSTAFTVPK